MSDRNLVMAIVLTLGGLAALTLFAVFDGDFQAVIPSVLLVLSFLSNILAFIGFLAVFGGILLLIEHVLDYYLKRRLIKAKKEEKK